MKVVKDSSITMHASRAFIFVSRGSFSRMESESCGESFTIRDPGLGSSGVMKTPTSIAHFISSEETHFEGVRRKGRGFVVPLYAKLLLHVQENQGYLPFSFGGFESMHRAFETRLATTTTLSKNSQGLRRGSSPAPRMTRIRPENRLIVSPPNMLWPITCTSI